MPTLKMHVRRSVLIVLSLALLYAPTPVFGKKHRLKKHSRKPAAAIQIETAITESDAFSLKRILQAENQRLAKDPYILNALNHPHSNVRQAAILALGRIGDATGVEGLSKILNGKDSESKKIAAFSLGLIGGDFAHKVLSQHATMERNPEVRSTVLIGLGRCGNESTAQLISKFVLSESDELVLSGAAEALGVLWSSDSAKWDVSSELLQRLLTLSAAQSNLSVASAFALSKYKGDLKFLPYDKILATIQRTPHIYVQGLLARVLAKIQSENLGNALSSLLVSPAALPLKIEVAKALKGRVWNPILATALKQSVVDKNSLLSISILETIGSYGLQGQELTDTVDILFKNSYSTWVKSVALKTLTRINPEQGRKRIHDILKVPTSPIFSSALAGLAILGTESELVELSPFIEAGNPQMISESLDSLLGLPADKINEKIKSAFKTVLSKGDMGLLSQVAEIVGQNKWKEFAAPLATAYTKLKKEDEVEAKVSLLNAMGVVGNDAQVALITLALEDPQKSVVVAAVAALKALTGKDESAKIPLNSKIIAQLPEWSEIMSALKAQVYIKTSRGTLTLKMLPDAPLTVVNFVQLAKKSFYNGKNFHRVVPNFVVQGGDPRGDGFGGPGYLIRDEVSPIPHERGSLGIATAGKDTGGSQFFFNLAPNLHLTGKYTNFAVITQGIEIAEQLEVWDKILLVTVK